MCVHPAISSPHPSPRQAGNQCPPPLSPVQVPGTLGSPPRNFRNSQGSGSGAPAPLIKCPLPALQVRDQETGSPESRPIPGPPSSGPTAPT